MRSHFAYWPHLHVLVPSFLSERATETISNTFRHTRMRSKMFKSWRCIERKKHKWFFLNHKFWHGVFICIPYFDSFVNRECGLIFDLSSIFDGTFSTFCSSIWHLYIYASDHRTILDTRLHVVQIWLHKITEDTPSILLLELGPAAPPRNTMDFRFWSPIVEFDYGWSNKVYVQELIAYLI